MKDPFLLFLFVILEEEWSCRSGSVHLQTHPSLQQSSTTIVVSTFVQFLKKLSSGKEWEEEVIVKLVLHHPPLSLQIVTPTPSQIMSLFLHQCDDNNNIEGYDN